jgi:hypothetical protein
VGAVFGIAVVLPAAARALTIRSLTAAVICASSSATPQGTRVIIFTGTLPDDPTNFSSVDPTVPSLPKNTQYDLGVNAIADFVLPSIGNVSFNSSRADCNFAFGTRAGLVCPQGANINVLLVPLINPASPHSISNVFASLNVFGDDAPVSIGDDAANFRALPAGRA